METRNMKSEHSPDRREFIKTGLLLLSGLALPSAAMSETINDPSPIHKRILRDASKNFADPKWTRESIRLMWSEKKRSGVTPLLRLSPPFRKDLHIYLKDESKSLTGSLKHRVAWGLVMGALVNGGIGPETHLYEATSGNTAIGEAYFASILGLPFTAVMRPGISELKIQAIRRYGGKIAIAPQGIGPTTYLERLLVDDPKGYNLNQFANTEKVLDFFDADPDRSMNMASEIFRQLQMESDACPEWFIAGAGSGGTATSIARYLRKWADFNGRNCPSRLAVVDPEDSVLYDWYLSGDSTLSIKSGSRIEGIGSSGPVVFGRTFSLLREGVSRMIKVPDSASIAAMQFISEHVGFNVGPSTGTNFFGTVYIMDQMHKEGRGGSLVSIICDDGNRYKDKYYNPEWIKASGMEPKPWKAALEKFWETGLWRAPDIMG
ncbi:MAG: cysteine synthase [Syntrophus sp. SKADARSKE-3]|nr:cysteine synthase [Syntrophus sp. SKADARSKE-3]